MAAVRMVGSLIRCSFRTAFRRLANVMATSVVAVRRTARFRLRRELRMALVIASSDMQPRRGMAERGHSTKQTDDNWSNERSHRGLSVCGELD